MGRQSPTENYSRAWGKGGGLCLGLHRAKASYPHFFFDPQSTVAFQNWGWTSDENGSTSDETWMCSKGQSKDVYVDVLSLRLNVCVCVCENLAYGLSHPVCHIGATVWRAVRPSWKLLWKPVWVGHRRETLVALAASGTGVRSQLDCRWATVCPPLGLQEEQLGERGAACEETRRPSLRWNVSSREQTSQTHGVAVRAGAAQAVSHGQSFKIHVKTAVLSGFVLLSHFFLNHVSEIEKISIVFQREQQKY